jgi:hypothetical protein
MPTQHTRAAQGSRARDRGCPTSVKDWASRLRGVSAPPPLRCELDVFKPLLNVMSKTPLWPHAAWQLIPKARAAEVRASHLSCAKGSCRRGEPAAAGTQ